jgi:hypothetical protein
MMRAGRPSVWMTLTVMKRHWMKVETVYLLHNMRYSYMEVS